MYDEYQIPTTVSIYLFSTSSACCSHTGRVLRVVNKRDGMCITLAGAVCLVVDRPTQRACAAAALVKGGQCLLRSSNCDTEGMLLRIPDYLIVLPTKSAFNARRSYPNRMCC